MYHEKTPKINFLNTLRVHLAEYLHITGEVKREK